MVVAPVDQGHVDRLPSEEAGGRKTAEPTADDDHPVPTTGWVGTGRGGIGRHRHRDQADRG